VGEAHDPAAVEAAVAARRDRAAAKTTPDTAHAGAAVDAARRDRAAAESNHSTNQLPALPELPALAPGETAFAQLRLDAATPLAALPGDRFLLRGFVATATHGTTIGGGRIIRVLAPKARGAQHADAVAQLARARPEQRLALDVQAAAFAGLGIADLVHRRGLPADALAAPLATLVAGGELLVTGSGDHAHYLHAKPVAQVEGRITEALASAPDGLGREKLRGALPAALSARGFDAILAGLERRGLVHSEADQVRRAGPAQRRAPSSGEAAVLDKFRAWGLCPERPKDVPAALGITEAVARPILERLVAGKRLVKIKPDLYMHADAVAEIRQRLLAFLEAHKTIDAQQWKELTAASRKFTIPLAEYFDAERVTLRVGDLRRKR
jgi:selenocysteine-specific elongation factor